MLLIFPQEIMKSFEKLVKFDFQKFAKSYWDMVLLKLKLLKIEFKPVFTLD